MPELSLEKRLVAALYDISLVSAAWIILLLPIFSAAPENSEFSLPRPGALLVVLTVCGFFAVESLTGLTLGKWLAQMRVLNPDGSPVFRGRLALRGLLKFLLTALCFSPLLVNDLDARIALAWIALVPLLIIVATTYIGLVRVGRSAFDMAAGTVVRRI